MFKELIDKRNFINQLKQLIRDNKLSEIRRIIHKANKEENEIHKEILINELKDFYITISNAFDEEGNFNLKNDIMRSGILSDYRIIQYIEKQENINLSDLEKDYINYIKTFPSEFCEVLANINVPLDEIYNGEKFTEEFINILMIECLGDYNKFKLLDSVINDSMISGLFSDDILLLFNKIRNLSPSIKETYMYIFEELINQYNLEDISLLIEWAKNDFNNDFVKDLCFLGFKSNFKSNINIEKDLFTYTLSVNMRKIIPDNYNLSELESAVLNSFGDNYNDFMLFRRNGIKLNKLDDCFFLRNGEIFIQDNKIELLCNELTKDNYLIFSKYKYNKDCYNKLNDNQKKVLTIYNNMDIRRFSVFSDYMNDLLKTPLEEVERTCKIINKIIDRSVNSNAEELEKFCVEIARNLVNNKNPDKALDLIIDIYSKNQLPEVGKLFYVFKIMYPEYTERIISSNSSPILQKAQDDKERDIIIYNDLLKCALGSNNKSLKDYLIVIDKGNELYLKILNKEVDINSLNQEDMHTLKLFVNNLNTLYNNTQAGKLKPRLLKNNLLEDLMELSHAFKPTSRYDLKDRIVRSFAYSAGFKSFDEVWNYINNKTKEANKKGIINGNKPFSLDEGDFVKGFDSNFLYQILQNGSVSKEFLGSSAKSDHTPLDTDLSRILVKKETLSETIENTLSNAYGSAWIVLKNDGRFDITKDEQGEKNIDYSGKLEVFKSINEGHYGIRTGFASSEIDYIIVDSNQINNQNLMEHMIVLNGFYIPIVDLKTEKIIFTYEDYLRHQQKMKGLTRYSEEEYEFSKNLSGIEEIDKLKENIESNQLDSDNKKEKIYIALEKAIEKLNLKLKTKFDFDTSLGDVQLIDTGSTARGTNTDKSSDFDFVMRIDNNISAEKLKDLILNELQAINLIDGKNIRCKGVNIEGLEQPIDLDITFLKKSKTNFYSTDAALKDRLDQIKKQDFEKYKDVIANIMFAKKFLKASGVYKASHTIDSKDGGLGGVGIENWILQNGGSFVDAAIDFINNAEGKSFEDFKKNYKIFDFGKNFYNGEFDEFINDNMTEIGYKKMVITLTEFLKYYNRKKQEGLSQTNIGGNQFSDPEELIDLDQLESESIGRGL